MNCRRVEQLLSDHLEGRLTEREADAVARHLGGCPACRQRQETFAALGTDLPETCCAEISRSYALKPILPAAFTSCLA